MHRLKISAMCLIFAALAAPLLPRSGNAREQSGLCDIAAQRASDRYGVPQSVMLAIARVETGRQKDGALRPWPWTMNINGAGKWFETKAEAVSAAETALASGNRNFDVGCFQINLRWHSKGFVSLDDMFEPEQNADYAAQFLADLYRTQGGWREATAAYHSSTPALAKAYVEKVETVLADLKHADVQAPAPVDVSLPVRRENSFPLLQPGGATRFGSLVPVFAPGAPLVGGSP